MNTLTKTSSLYTPEDIFIVTPNNDTYYSKGVLDLRAEPVIIRVPEANEPYYVLQLVDMLTYHFDYIGTNSTGSAPGILLLPAELEWNIAFRSEADKISLAVCFCKWTYGCK